MIIKWPFIGCYSYKTIDFRIINKIKKKCNTMCRFVTVIKLDNIKKFKATENTAISAKTQSGDLRLYQFFF
jgi:hypothetical protein